MRDTDTRRAKLYKWAIGLSVVYVLDGIFMAWALMAQGYATLGYGQVGFVPVFIPALLAGLVVIGMYLHGFARRAWKARLGERIFFLCFACAIVAKAAVIMHRHCCR